MRKDDAYQATEELLSAALCQRQDIFAHYVALFDQIQKSLDALRFETAMGMRTSGTGEDMIDRLARSKHLATILDLIQVLAS